MPDDIYMYTYVVCVYIYYILHIYYLQDRVTNIRTITISEWSRASTKVTGKLAPGSTVVNDVEPCGDGDHVSLPAMTIDKEDTGSENDMKSTHTQKVSTYHMHTHTITQHAA